MWSLGEFHGVRRFLCELWWVRLTLFLIQAPSAIATISQPISLYSFLTIFPLHFCPKFILLFPLFLLELLTCFYFFGLNNYFLFNKSLSVHIFFSFFFLSSISISTSHIFLGLLAFCFW